MAIASRAAECAQLFDRYASTLAEDEPLIQDMENQIFRFNLWVTSNFILAPSRASMDWRLRNAPLQQSTMVELLDDLKSDLITQSTLSYSVTIPKGMQDENFFHAVSKTLDGLFRLSRAIRRSGILRRYMKVGNHVEFDEDGVNLTEAFCNGAKTLIDFRMKESKASEGLRQRIIDTICLRQQYFSYQKTRKAENGPIATKTDQGHQATPRSALRSTASITGSLTSKTPRKATKQSPRMQRARQSIKTATTAQPDRMKKAYSGNSANERPNHGVDYSDADVPPPPKVFGNIKESECPYCFVVCSKEELSGTRWKRHIIEDLMPYICVLESCPTPNSLFESSKEWLNHMRNQHPSSGWTCVDKTHDTSFFFQSESGFIDHLHQFHEDQFEDDDIDDIAAACYQQLPEDIIIKECPFCPKVQNVELGPSDMINHIAYHLIALAQISLAGHIDGDQSQSAWSESKRNPSSRPASAGSVQERLHSDFRDSDDHEGPTFLSDEVIPDADVELVDTLWQKVQKPQEDPSRDLTLHHFITKFEIQAKEITKDVAGNTNNSIIRETSKDSVRWATMSEPDSGADVLQAALNESHRKAIGIRGKQGSPRLDPENTDDHHVPPFLCQSVAEIHDKFEDLEWMQRVRLTEGMLSNDPAHPYYLESDPKVKARNRYVNVQAWANSRIHLRVPEGECDFINASPITLKDSATQEKRKYIATQGPKLGYISHFWHMVFHESKDVAVIVMLTQTFEAGREKCAQYFPLDDEQVSMTLTEESAEDADLEQQPETMIEPVVVEESHAEETVSEESKKRIETTVTERKVKTAEAEEPAIVSRPVAQQIVTEKAPRESAEIVAAKMKVEMPSTIELYVPSQKSELEPMVTNQSSPVRMRTFKNMGKVTLLESTFDAKSRSEIRKLQLTIGSESKIVWHFLFAGWADYSKPEGNDREALLELIKLSASKSGPDNPRVVHCSAGVGRTGTFIALDYLLQELESGQLLQVADPETDPIFETVNLMREQRMMMVYNEMQMQFIYEVLREQTDIKLGKVYEQKYGSPGSQIAG